MDVWQLVAERKIREAMEEGAFDHLEGTGKPLDLSENPFEDPSERMANRLLKNNGISPAWIVEAKEIEAEAHRLGIRDEAAKGDYQERVAALNRRIASFNLRAPASSLHKRPFHKSS